MIDRAPARLESLDVTRGIIIALMALDHARMFIARSHPSEYWGVPLPEYTDAAPFLARLVTHLCAPGFFFLLGAGVILLADRRRTSSGWEPRAITRHLVIRGAVLLLIQHIVINPAWGLGGAGADIEIERYGLTRRPGTEGDVLAYVGVITALGASLIIGALCRALPASLLFLLGLLVAVLTSLALPASEHAFSDYNVGFRLLLIPGQAGFVQVLYPILPWLTATFWGMAWGRLLLREQEATLRWSPAMGALLLLAFVVIRRVEGFGNFHTPEATWIGWLNVTKYPPSLAFLTLTLGVNLVLLGLVHRIRVLRTSKTLSILGGVALFFYVVHLYVYALIGWFFPRGTSLGWMMVVWLLGLVVLLPVCKRYLSFKRSTPSTSIWRLF